MTNTQAAWIGVSKLHAKGSSYDELTDAHARITRMQHNIRCELCERFDPQLTPKAYPGPIPQHDILLATPDDPDIIPDPLAATG